MSCLQQWPRTWTNMSVHLCVCVCAWKDVGVQVLLWSFCSLFSLLTNPIPLCHCQFQVLSLWNAAADDFNRTNWNWQFTPLYRSSHFKTRPSTLRAANRPSLYMCVHAWVLLFVCMWEWQGTQRTSTRIVRSAYTCVRSYWSYFKMASLWTVKMFLYWYHLEFGAHVLWATFFFSFFCFLFALYYFWSVLSTIFHFITALSKHNKTLEVLI